MEYMSRSLWSSSCFRSNCWCVLVECMEITHNTCPAASSFLYQLVAEASRTRRAEFGFLTCTSSALRTRSKSSFSSFCERRFAFFFSEAALSFVSLRLRPLCWTFIKDMHCFSASESRAKAFGGLGLIGLCCATISPLCIDRCALPRRCTAAEWTEPGFPVASSCES